MKAITRRELLAASLAGAALAAWPRWMDASMNTKPSQPNVILCMADDLSWGDVRCNGNQIIKTPNIEGLRFDRVNANSPVCSPICGG